MPADVAVVVVTYNSADVVEGLLDSIPVALGDCSSEVVVVDNGSRDGTVSLLQARGDCTVLSADNRGYAAGINRGVEVIPDTEAILVLNPDVRLGPRSVERMFRTLRDTGAGVVAPRIHDDSGRLYLSLRRAPTLLRAMGLGSTRRPAFAEWLSLPHEYESRRIVEWATGAVLMVDRRCHDELGGWDESFFLYSEETDFCLRAADRGWVTVYEPDAVTSHIGGASGRNGRTHAMLMVNRVRLYARRHPCSAGWAYLLVTLAHECSWTALGRRDSRAAAAALVSPRRRPAELGLSQALLPR